MYTELNWTISFLGITDGGTPGSPANPLPTAFIVKARFEYRQMHAGIFYRFQMPRWTNMSEDEVATHIVEQTPWYGPGQAEPVADPITGVGDGVIASYGNTGAGIPNTAGYNPATGLFSTPITLRRTLRHFQQGVRVNATGTSVTGGTTPRFLLGIEYLGS
ncbi:hypothetical protein ACXPWS_13580 [Mycobacterium sp. BMJ-28]